MLYELVLNGNFVPACVFKPSWFYSDQIYSNIYAQSRDNALPKNILLEKTLRDKEQPLC